MLVSSILMILVQIQVVHFVLQYVLDLHVDVLFYQRVILKHLRQYCCNYAQVLLLALHCYVSCLYFHVSRRETVHNCYHHLVDYQLYVNLLIP